MNTNIRGAKPEDINNLVSFLQNANLSTEGIAESLDSFLIMEDSKGGIKATIGIEPFEKMGLLRSLVMTADTNENDLFRLFEQSFLQASEKGMTDLFMATNKLGAIKFVQILGFNQINKTELPLRLRQSEHVKHILTVNNSVFLKLSI